MIIPKKVNECCVVIYSLDELNIHFYTIAVVAVRKWLRNAEEEESSIAGQGEFAKQKSKEGLNALVALHRLAECSSSLCGEQ